MYCVIRRSQVDLLFLSVSRQSGRTPQILHDMGHSYLETFLPGSPKRFAAPSNSHQYRAISSTDNEICLFPAATSDAVCCHIAELMVKLRDRRKDRGVVSDGCKSQTDVSSVTGASQDSSVDSDGCKPKTEVSSVTGASENKSADSDGCKPKTEVSSVTGASKDKSVDSDGCKPKTEMS